MSTAVPGCAVHVMWALVLLRPWPVHIHHNSLHGEDHDPEAPLHDARLRPELDTVVLRRRERVAVFGPPNTFIGAIMFAALASARTVWLSHPRSNRAG